MKILMYLAKNFSFRPFEKTLPAVAQPAEEVLYGQTGGLSTPAAPEEEVQVEQAVVIFVHCEPQDEAGPAGLETKFVKNVKWIAGKRGFKNVVLHSFTHLAEASASPQFAETFLQSAAARLGSTGYLVTLTPFGWTCEWKLSVYGESLAKVFKSL